MLKLYLVSLLLEALMYFRPFWRFRTQLIPIVLMITSFSVTGLLFQDFSLISVAVAILVIFRVLNLLRIAKGRMHPNYLYYVTRRTSLWLGLYHLLVLATARLVNDYLTSYQIWLFYAAGLLVTAASVCIITFINIYKTRHVNVAGSYADRDLPTVTVAIPARNETLELEECLRSILANDYPKLEVIVLDDCSQDRTSEIIRDFAHDGVRFVRGAEPHERWLSKNQAYQKLYEESSGELILFCGVDVRFGTNSVRALVTTMLNRKKQMTSIMPRRLTGNFTAGFLQPMRYWWELALPRRPFNRPPVLSTCWLISRATLKRLGGFAAVSHTILPEGYFAREVIKNDGYSFIRADDLLDIQTRKGLSEQQETAIRTNYPLLRRRLEWLMLISVINLFGLVVPFGLALSAIWLGLGPVQLYALAACGFLVATHLSIIQVSNPPNILVGLFNLPVASLAEFILGYASMWQYEFGVIEWKGRNICIPVMHVTPKLPAIPEK